MALSLGRTVAELERTLGTAELADWHRFWAIEPWGALRDNMHAGLIAAELRAPRVKRGKKLPSFKDFMLRDAEAAKQERRAGTAHAIKTLMAMAKRKPNG